MVDMELAHGTFSKVIVFRLKPGTDVQQGMEEACARSGISNGVIVSAIGSLASAAFCDVINRSDLKSGYGYGAPLTLEGPLELTGISGIVCHDHSGAVNLHAHMSVCDRYGNAHGGHLTAGTKVLLTVDCVVAEIAGAVMGREYDPSMDAMLFAPSQG